jgi:hypothetical protein
MHSILIVIEKPTTDELETQQTWRNATRALYGKIHQLETVEILSENVLLISLANGLQTFESITRICTDWLLPYRVLFFEEAPSWIHSQK